MNAPFENEKDLKALFEPARDIELPDAVEEHMRRELQRLEDRIDAAKPHRSHPWRIPSFPIRFKALPVAVASSVVILGAVALLLLFSSGGSSPAFARVLESIRAFGPYAYTQTTFHEGQPDYSRRILRKSLTQRREEFPSGQILIFDIGAVPVRVLTLIPREKRAIEKELTGIGPARDPDLLQVLANAAPDAAVSLGEKTIDGRRAQGFHIPDPVNDWTVWVDPQTLLPIRIELRQPQIQRTMLMTDFDFDTPLDDALFDTTAPAGYSVERTAVDGSTPTEDDLLKGLRLTAALLGGEFPPSLEWPDVQQAIRDHFAAIGQTPPEADLETLRESYSRLQRFLDILRLFRRVRNLEYAGEGVQLGDADIPILWWQPQTPDDTWRVVFGDLTIHDVSAEDFPNPAASEIPADEN